MTATKTVVLTGGPCGGKTELMNVLRRRCLRGNHFLLLPEAAPIVFNVGVRTQPWLLQRTIVQVQLAMENTIIAARDPTDVLICHRGTLDPLAYWLMMGGKDQDFYDVTGMSQMDHFSRYSGVIHMQTTAHGAEANYLRWPQSHRLETVGDAQLLDDLCRQIWSSHPMYFLIENRGLEWSGKAEAALRIMDMIIAD